jgi:hypothetical protein
MANGTPGAGRRRGLAVLAAAAVLGFASSSAAARCVADGRGVVVDLRPVPGQVKYQSASPGQLRRLRDRARGTAGKLGWHAVGFTRTEVEYRMRVTVSAAPLSTRLYCVSLTSVDATLGYGTLDVYIDAKYPRRSCAYGSIMAHENAHVDIFRTTLERFAPRLRAHLRRATGRMEPIRAVSPDDGAERLKERLRHEIEPLFNDMNRVLNRANAKLATTRNYKREQERCGDW